MAQERDKNDPDAFQEEAAQIYSTIFHKYNERVRPPDNFPNPVLVTVEATLYHIRDLDLNRREMESLLDLKIVSDTSVGLYVMILVKTRQHRVVKVREWLTDCSSPCPNVQSTCYCHIARILQTVFTHSHYYAKPP